MELIFLDKDHVELRWWGWESEEAEIYRQEMDLNIRGQLNIKFPFRSQGV